MALTRPKLKEILSKAGADDEKITEAIEAILSGHTATVDALKEERDTYKENAEKLPKVEKELNELKKAHENDGANVYETKYNELKSEYEEYKDNVEAEKTKRAKTSAYKALLKEVGVAEKRIDSILKVTNLDEIQLDTNGKIKDEESKKEAIKTEWSDFVVNTETSGAKTETPPANNGGKSTKTVQEIRAIKDPNERQKAMAENPELFGLKTERN